MNRRPFARLSGLAPRPRSRWTIIIALAIGLRVLAACDTGGGLFTVDYGGGGSAGAMADAGDGSAP